MSAMRFRSAAAFVLALLSFAPAGAQDQGWPQMPLQRVTVGDSLVFEVHGPYLQQRQDLLLVFLRTPGFPGSNAFATTPDSLAVLTLDRQVGSWVPVGGIDLDLFTTAVHLDDFDRNGYPDLFVEWYTGGNGAASSGGAVYEFRWNGRASAGMSLIVRRDGDRWSVITSDLHWIS